MVDPAVAAVAVILAGFVPPVLWLWWLRSQERREREPWGQLAKAFAWGAIPGVLLALLFSFALLAVLEPAWALLGFAAVVPFTAVSSTLVAPVAEEPAKAYGLRWVKDPVPEPEDGLVYGAAAGLGFAAAENILYVADAYATNGFAGLLLVGSIRAFASAFLHASASGLVGFAFFNAWPVGRKLSFLLLAVLLHGTYNGLLSIGGILAPFVERGGPLEAYVGEALALALGGFATALLLAIVTFTIIRKHVRKLDRADHPM